MGTISRRKQAIRDAAERVAPDLDKWRRRNRYFHDEDARYLQFLISPEVRVLDLGCGNGDLLASLRPSEGKGVDFSPAMVAPAKRPTPHYLVPSLVVIAMLMPLALHFVIEGRQHIRAAVAVGSIGLLSLLVQHGISALEFEVAGAERADVALRQMTARLQQANCRPLPYYRFSPPEYALLFGNDFMGHAYAKTLTLSGLQNVPISGPNAPRTSTIFKKTFRKGS